MISTKPLEQVSAADLNELVTQKQAEGRRLDFKRDLELSKDEHKRELARDVSAFANGAGGDLVYGIEEEKGVATSIVGVDCPNFDHTKLRFEAILADNLEPRVHGVAFHKVEGGFPRGPVIIVRIPKSWNAPHMVTSTSSVFWTRNNSGRQALDVHEIRSAFLAGAEIATRVRRFRDERIGKILAAETPVPLRVGLEAIVLVHVVPLATEPVVFDLHKIEGTPGMLRPPGASGYSDRFNLDGFVTYAGPSTGEQRCYCQAFRDGRIESVSTGFQYPGKEGGPRELYALALEADVVKSLDTYLKVLAAHGSEGPVSVMLSVLGVKGSRIKSGDDGWRAAPWEENVTIDRDILILPDVVVERLPADPRAFMRDVFHSLWQSSGYKRSLGYSESGEWDPKKHHV
jgi:hypothetical protein